MKKKKSVRRRGMNPKTLARAAKAKEAREERGQRGPAGHVGVPTSSEIARSLPERAVAIL
jgi:hypothetical protein